MTRILTPAQLEAKRKRDRDRIRRLHAAARGDAPKLAPIDEHRLKGQLRAERDKATDALKELLVYREAHDAMAAVTAAPLAPIERVELRSGLREATAIAMLSDAHVEETVRPGETPYPNMYNPEIADRSLGRFFAGIEWKLKLYRSAFQIRNLLLWLGGDLMTGHIHPENVENTSGTPIETMLWLYPRLVDGIERLLEDPRIERLLIPCSYGNHGRNTPKPYRALGAVHSYEWALYQLLSQHFAARGEKRVQFLADKSAHQYARVYGFDLHFHHGDETNYGGGVGGITIPINKATAQWDKAKRCHYHHFGHWHQYSPGGRVTMNGSVIGYSAYAMSIKADPEDPQQAFYLLDSKRGKTCCSPIWVRDSKDLPVTATDTLRAA